MSKKIALDALMLSNRRAGIGNYQYNLINALKGFPYEFDVYTSESGIIKSSENINVITVPGINTAKKRLLFQLFGFADALNRGKYDIVHFLDYMTPLKKINSKSLVTVHDVGFCTGKNYFTKQAAFFKKHQMPRVIKNADGIITVSDFTKSEIIKYFPKADESKITTVHLGVDIANTEATKLPEGIKKPFVLFVSTVEPRKNIISLIKSMEILWDEGEEAQLVIAGKFGWLYDETVSYAKCSRHAEKIKFTGFITDGELEALYNSAEVFVFPSDYEGFGLPPLEAMRRGVATISSKNASMPEILGNGAYFANGAADTSKKIKALLGSSDEKDELIKRGIMRSKNFTWQKTAEQTAKIYEKLLSE